MSTDIFDSVGERESGARNVLDDVVMVQNLLVTLSELDGRPEISLRAVDGRIGNGAVSETVAAIKIYQRSVGEVATGIMWPGDATFAKLVHDVEHATRREGHVPQSPSAECFPFERKCEMDWSSPPRSFGANRAGTRAHAGCDLYAAHGTWIRAIRPGTVLAGPTEFYGTTYALEIDHGEFLVRYGEIRKFVPVRKGDSVVAGQRIGMVGHLVGISVPSDMLHLEMYSKASSGNLTERDERLCCKRSDGVPFFRRSDLIDPTPTLNRLAERHATTI